LPNVKADVSDVVRRNVVDSSGWIEFFRDGSHAGEFAAVLSNPTELVVPTITIAEVCRYLYRFVDAEAAEVATGAMCRGVLVPLDESIAVSAARIGVSLKLPMADSIVLATARAYEAAVWTLDSDFEGLPDVHYVPK
jgi:predicted nucleic acid-binding protein